MVAVTATLLALAVLAPTAGAAAKTVKVGDKCAKAGDKAKAANNVNVVCTKTNKGLRWGVVKAATTTTVKPTSTTAPKVKLDTKNPVRIVFVGGESGPTAGVVKEAMLGVRSAIADIEAHGGVLGRAIKVEIVDDAGDPTQAVSALQRYLASHDKPDFVIPGVSSTEALALVPVLSREKIISMNNAASPLLDKPSDYPFHFGYSVTAAGLEAGLPSILKGMNVHKLGVLTPNDAYGKSIVSAVLAVFAGNPDIDINVEQFNPADLDVSISYQRVVDGKPDAIFFEAIGDPALRMVQARTSVNTDIPGIAGYGVSGVIATVLDKPKYLRNLRMQAFRFQQYIPAAQRSPITNRFFTQVNTRGGVPTSILTPGLFWDVTQVMAAGANQAGTTKAADVKELFESSKFKVPPLLMWTKHGWTENSHFPKPPAIDFGAIKPGPLVDGMFKGD